MALAKSTISTNKGAMWNSLETGAICDELDMEKELGDFLHDILRNGSNTSFRVIDPFFHVALFAVYFNPSTDDWDHCSMNVQWLCFKRSICYSFTAHPLHKADVGRCATSD